MLGRRDVLLAKHQHLVCHQCLTQLARLLLAHGLAQVYARDLHAYGGRDAPELDPRPACRGHLELGMGRPVFAIDHDLSPKRCNTVL
ncbi:hypothetical protein SDC9_202520 [bioreactor metagenome]|uniref:Uncharacterized protein n=1 Tax=bioreactor metagenome TaxID=1076179 RepID=A0A645J5U9_9ZZZZ